MSSKAEALLKVHNANSSMFADAAAAKHSRIFNALNPQPLAFQTARDRAERDETVDMGRIGVRGYFSTQAARDTDEADFESFASQMDGGDLEGDEEEEESEPVPDSFDPHNLPDFGEFTEEMMARRAARAAEEQRRREQLQREHAARKAREQAAMAKELAEIQAREAAKKSKEQVTDDMVREAQARVAKEMTFGAFVFK